ncbi:MAG: hypothetical protein AABY13_00300, partial [Nanoarchaeota archaeon]
AADLIVLGITSYARRLGLSDYITGLVVVAMAASMPEVIASMTALVAGREDVLFGTILGTNMVHIALVPGLLAVLGRKVEIESTILAKALLPLWVVLMIPFVLIAIDGELGRTDGIVLLLLFCLYLVWLWNQEKKLGLMKKSVRVKTLWRDSFIFLGSLIVLLIAGQTLVFSSITFAGIVGIPAYFLAITIIAVGGALPDLAVGIKSVTQGHGDVGVGDILGSIAIEFLLFFGMVGIFHPIRIAVGEVFNVMVFLTIGLTLLLYFVHKQVMTWKNGIVLLALYALFMLVEIYKVVRV